MLGSGRPVRGAGPASCPEPFGPLPGPAVPAGPQSWSELDLRPCPEVAGLWPGAGASQYACVLVTGAGILHTWGHHTWPYTPTQTHPATLVTPFRHCLQWGVWRPLLMPPNSSLSSFKLSTGPHYTAGTHTPTCLPVHRDQCLCLLFGLNFPRETCSKLIK